MTYAEAHAELENPKSVKFNTLLKISIHFFGEPRNNGTSHFVFKTPWPGLPFLNLQRDGKQAKPYQVKQVRQALTKLEEMNRESK